MKSRTFKELDNSEIVDHNTFNKKRSIARLHIAIIDSGAIGSITPRKKLPQNCTDFGQQQTAKGVGYIILNFGRNLVSVPCLIFFYAKKTILTEEDILNANIQYCVAENPKLKTVILKGVLIPLRVHNNLTYFPNKVFVIKNVLELNNLHLRFGHVNAKSSLNSINQKTIIANDKEKKH